MHFKSLLKSVRFIPKITSFKLMLGQVFSIVPLDQVLVIMEKLCHNIIFFRFHFPSFFANGRLMPQSSAVLGLTKPDIIQKTKTE